jgi:anti-sigma B factor antagonist
MDNRSRSSGNSPGRTPALLDVRVERDGTDARVSAVGEIDLASTPYLDTALDGLTSNDAVRKIIVDLSGVTFLDSSGLHALFKRARGAEVDGYELEVVRTPAHIRRLFTLTGLDHVVRFGEG